MIADNPKRPSCPIVPDRQGRLAARVVGWYEGWNVYRPYAVTDDCRAGRPSSITPWMYTHLNFAFAHVHPSTFEVAMAREGDRFLYHDLVYLKEYNKDLKVYISITPWDMYREGLDGQQSTFSSLVGSEKYQKKFFQSLKAFIKATGFDGVDVYWPYPGVEAHGGRSEDHENFSVFIGRLREALEKNDRQRSGLTVTLPLDHERIQGFDLKQLEPHVEFFNTVPQKPSADVTTVAKALEQHRSLAKAATALDGFWAQNISPEKVTLALSLRIHTFHLSNPGCSDASCEIVGYGQPTSCSGGVGNMWRTETKRLSVFWDPWTNSPAEDKDHSYQERSILLQNTPELLKEYVELAQSLCLGGVSMWGGIGNRYVQHSVVDPLREKLGMRQVNSPATYSAYAAFLSGAETNYRDFAYMGTPRHPNQPTDPVLPMLCQGRRAKADQTEELARLCLKKYKYNYKKVVPDGPSARDPLGYGSGRGNIVTAPPSGQTPAADTTEKCSTWHVVHTGETCRSLLAKYDVDLPLFVAANPSLATTADSCTAALIPGRAYCVVPMDLFDLPYKEVGCYYSINGQVMGSAWHRKHFTHKNKNMTPRACATLCELDAHDQSSIVFGLENGDTCLCDRGVYFDSSKVKDKYCNKPCAGQPAAMCGGKKYTSVYVTERKADEPLRKFERRDAVRSLGGPSFGHGKKCGKSDPWAGFGGVF